MLLSRLVPVTRMAHCHHLQTTCRGCQTKHIDTRANKRDRALCCDDTDANRGPLAYRPFSCISGEGVLIVWTTLDVVENSSCSLKGLMLSPNLISLSRECPGVQTLQHRHPNQQQPLLQLLLGTVLPAPVLKRGKWEISLPWRSPKFASLETGASLHCLRGGGLLFVFA